MARSSFCMTSFLLLSLVILASAYDYEYDQKSELDYNQPKSEGKEKLPINKLEEKQKYFTTKSDHYEQPKPEQKEKHVPTKKEHKNYEQPKSEEKQKYFPTKQEHKNYEQPKSEETKPYHKNYEQPKLEKKEKLPINYAEKKQPKEDEEKEKFVPTKSVYGESNYYEGKENFVPTKPDYEVLDTINVQGLVYCKTGLKYFPLQGAMAKVTCLAIDEESYKTTQFSVLSKPCDSKGYFHATISSPKSQWKIKDCTAYLNYSPLKSCNVPTNANNGISGDLFASVHKILSHQKDKKLFSAGPFYYTSYDKPTDYTPVPKPDGY